MASSLSRLARMQTRAERAGQDHFAKAQYLLIKLVSLERAPVGFGRFDDGLS